MKQKTEKAAPALLEKKLMKSRPGWETQPKERLSYYLYFAGQNAIYALKANYFVQYLSFVMTTDTEKAWQPIIILIAGIWDAVNDVIFGLIFDKVRFKSKQKYLPWLKISLPFIPATTILLFAIPSGSSAAVKLAWLAIAHVLWDAAYTLCDVPIFGIITAMTKNLDERTTALSYKSIWSGIGSGVAILAGTVLVGKDIALNYTVVAIVCAVFAILTMIPACLKLKERYEGEDEENFTLKRMFKYLLSNKYLLIYYLGYFFYSSANVFNLINLYAAFYFYHNEQLSLVAQICSIVPSLVAALLVPHILRKFEKMKVFRFCALLAIAASVVMWIPGYDSLVWFIVMTVVRSVPMSVVGVMLFMFTPDCAEYGLYKTGVDAKGITFSIQTFMVKITATISSVIVSLFYSLKWVGWKTYTDPATGKALENFADLAKHNATQEPQTLKYLWFLYVMVPAIGYAIAYVIWRFYKLKDKDVQIMIDCNVGKISKEEAESSFSMKY